MSSADFSHLPACLRPVWPNNKHYEAEYKVMQRGQIHGYVERFAKDQMESYIFLQSSFMCTDVSDQNEMIND